jgi:hypothetical protein
MASLNCMPCGCGHHQCVGGNLIYKFGCCKLPLCGPLIWIYEKNIMRDGSIKIYFSDGTNTTINPDGYVTCPTNRECPGLPLSSSRRSRRGDNVPIPVAVVPISVPGLLDPSLFYGIDPRDPRYIDSVFEVQDELVFMDAFVNSPPEQEAVLREMYAKLFPNAIIQLPH